MKGATIGQIEGATMGQIEGRGSAEEKGDAQKGWLGMAGSDRKEAEGMRR